MEKFFNDIPNQILLFKGDLNYLHYITFAIGIIMLIVGIVQLKNRVVKGLFTIVTTLFYTLCFSITANNYATTESIQVFFFTSVILNLLIWIIVSRLGFKKSFSWLWGYLFAIVPIFIVGMLSEAFPISDNIIWQFSLLFTSLLLCFLVPCIMNIGDNSSVPTAYRGGKTYTGSRSNNPGLNTYMTIHGTNESVYYKDGRYVDKNGNDVPITKIDD